MIDVIQRWLLGITCAALVAALAESLTPQGAVRKIGRLTSGLVLLIALVSPLLSLDQDALTKALTEYRLDVGAYSDDLEQENRQLMKDIIEERCAAYIQDKAETLGIDCYVTIETWGEGDWPIPESIVVYGALTEEQQTELTRMIETDFAIPSDRQRYENGGAA